MPDTVDALEIGSSWVNLNVLTGIPVGSGMTIQHLGARSGAIINTGVPNAVIEITANNVTPTDDFIGWHVEQNEQWIIAIGEPIVWVRYSRITGQTVGTEKALIKVQSGTAIEKYVANSPLSRDFLTDVGLGRVDGYSQASVVMRNPSCSNTEFTDVWAGTGNMSLASSAETWEISSDNASDSNGGTGAWTVLISSLDETKAVQAPQVVNLDGTTWVSIPGTHFRPNNLAATRGAFVLYAGTEESNIGTLTVRDVASGDVRMVITPMSGINEDGQITCPLGFTLFALKVLISWPKNENGDVYNSIKPDGSNTARISSGRLPLYQNVLDLNFQAKFRTSEKTDRVFRANSENLGSELTIIQEFLIVDNEYI